MTATEESVICGFHAVEAVLTKEPRAIRRILVVSERRDERMQSLVQRARELGVRVDSADRRVVTRIAGVKAHQGIVAECHAVLPSTELDFEARWSTFTQPLILVVDGVTDPRNLGACMRSAGAADVDAVLIPKRSNAPLSNVVRKTASGALEDLLIVQVSNLARRLDWLRERGVWIVGTDVESIHAYTDVDYRDPVAIVVGGEQRGLRHLTREKCDHLVTIPMRGPVSSLNVSVATGILLFECLRQRGT